jgi:hypothetical protein
MNAVGVRATVLSPLTYHGLVTQGGSSTIADLLSDKAMAFGIASALGWLPQGVCLPVESHYAADLGIMPYRCSLFTPAKVVPRLMPPQARKLNIDAEGGRQKSLSDTVSSGNVKDYFTVQSVAPGAVYEGLIHGSDPFAEVDDTRLVVRMGLGRQSELLLEKIAVPARVRLNAHTGQLFGRSLACETFYLYTLQASPRMTAAEAAAELGYWYP